MALKLNKQHANVTDQRSQTAVEKYLRELREVLAGDAQAANAALRKVCPEKFPGCRKTEGAAA